MPNNNVTINYNTTTNSCTKCNGDEVVDEAEDTLTILNKYVDGITEESIDNDRLKTLLKELYVEALNTEQA